jgi:uncharacterized Zn finger protein
VSRESVDSKGRRYLTEGRLTVLHVDEALVRASCRGGGAVYVLGWSGDGWWCGCAARGRCSHLAALELVVVREAVDADDDPEPEIGVRSSGAGYGGDEEPEVGL